MSVRAGGGAATAAGTGYQERVAAYLTVHMLTKSSVPLLEDRLIDGLSFEGVIARSVQLAASQAAQKMGTDLFNSRSKRRRDVLIENKSVPINLDA